MMELTFIPLKTPEGATCGFAKVSGGFAELKLHAPVDGQAAVLTESGVVEGPPASRIAVPGARVQAVAVHVDGQLRCFGIARGAALGAEQVRARLMTCHRDAAPPAATARAAGGGPKAAGDAPKAAAAPAREPGLAASAAGEAAQGTAANAAGAEREPADAGKAGAAQAAGDAPKAMDVLMPAQPEENPRAATPADFAAAVRAAAAAPAREPGVAASAAGEAAPGTAAVRAAAEQAPAGAGKAGAAQAAGDAPKAMDVWMPAQPEENPRAATPADFAAAVRAAAAAPAREPEVAASAAGEAAPGTAANAAGAEREPADAGTLAAGDAPKTGAGAEEAQAAQDAPASIEQSAADSESFMALLRRADAAFSKLSERRLPGVAPASSTAAKPASAPLRRSARHGEAQPVMQQPAAQPDGSAAQRTDAQPAPAAPSEPPAAPAMTRRFPEDAAQWGEEIDRLLEDCAATEQREPISNPFPNIFPGARFQRVTRPGMQPHLEGDWQRGGERLRITAVPGAYSPHPPAHLRDFTRYIRARSGGYWIRVAPC